MPVLDTLPAAGPAGYPASQVLMAQAHSIIPASVQDIVNAAAFGALAGAARGAAKGPVGILHGAMEGALIAGAGVAYHQALTAGKQD